MVAAVIMHKVNGTILLVASMLCYAIASVLGGAQPPGTIYWAMSFPAMRMLVLYLTNLSSYWRFWRRSEQCRCEYVCHK